MARTTPATCFVSRLPKRKLIAFIREALSFYDGSVKTSRLFYAQVPRVEVEKPNENHD